MQTVAVAALPALCDRPVSIFVHRLNLDTQTVAVAAHLPAGYLAVEPLGLGRGVSQVLN